MIKLFDLLKEQNNILVPRRTPEERTKNHIISINKKVQQYMKDGGKGSLDLNDTPITSLPDGLKVGGSLFLHDTLITSLPDGLIVGGSLDLYDTLITSLPNDLSVGGDLFLSNTPISEKYTSDQLKQMYPGVKGKIYI